MQWCNFHTLQKTPSTRIVVVEFFDDDLQLKERVIVTEPLLPEVADAFAVSYNRDSIRDGRHVSCPYAEGLAAA
jgi:hypothetical protein